MGVDGGRRDITTDYAPVLRMQAKAAELRAELMQAGVRAPGIITAHKPSLSVVVPDPDAASTSPSCRLHPSKGTPGRPVFKPQRPFSQARQSTASDAADPFTPFAPKARHSSGTVDATRGPRMSSPDRVPGSPDGTRDLSPTSSLCSRRSFSPGKSNSGVRRSSTSRTLRMSLAAQEVHAALGTQVMALEGEVEEWQRKFHDLEDDCAARQDSYMRREEALASQVATLQEQLAQARGERAAVHDTGRFASTSQALKSLHASMAAEIESLLQKQEVVTKHEEQGQARRLKAQLTQLELELTAERGVNGRTNSEWVARTAALRTELDAVQSIASKLDAMYKLSEEECRRLRAQFKCQEDDRDMLVRQVVGCRKENKRLAVELAGVAADAAAAARERDEALAALAALQDQVASQSDTGGGQWAGELPLHVARPGSARPGGGAAALSLQLTGDVAKDQQAVAYKLERYETVIDSLKRTCEAERRRTRQARAAHTSELAARTELQAVLRQAVDAVRAQRAQALGDSIAQPPDSEGRSGRGSQGGSSVGSGVGGEGSLGPGCQVAPHRRPVSAVVRPISAMHSRTGPNPWVTGRPPGGGARPTSALPTRPWSARPDSSAPAHRTHPAASRTLALQPAECSALVAELTRQEGLLVALMDRAFPAASPGGAGGYPPDLDRLVAAREARDAQVVAHARVLAAGGRGAGDGARGAPASETTQRLAAGKPWVFNVDTMLAGFLQPSPGGQQVLDT